MVTTELINHSCVVLRAEDWSVLCDPWFQGRVFADGWSLLIEDPERRIEGVDADALWVSHEHPDHFSVPDIRSVPEETRPRWPTLFQRTPDRKVVEFMEKLGYPVEELAPFARRRVAPGTEIVSGVVKGYDSWIAVSSGGTTVLNLNDCHPSREELMRIAEAVGDVDVLLTQFGYAAWAGNPGDHQLPQLARSQVFEKLEEQVRILRPDLVVPFASYVRFCHEENAHWNDFSMRPEESIKLFEALGVPSLIPVPGQLIEPGTRGDNAVATEFWADAAAKAHERPLARSTSVPLEALEAEFDEMQEAVASQNDWEAIVAAEAKGALPTSHVRITDLDLVVAINLVRGLHPEQARTPDDADIALHSEMLEYVLSNPWGRGTLSINGRFTANYERMWRFFRQMSVWYSNNIGWRYPADIELSTAADRRTYVVNLAQMAVA